jgi:signal transduction histidine kinase
VSERPVAPPPGPKPRPAAQARQPFAVDVREPPDVGFRRTVLVRIGLVFFALVLGGTIVRYAVSPMPPRIVISNVVVSLIFLATPLLARSGARPSVLAAPIMLGLLVILFNAGMLAGGVNAPVAALSPLLPMLGFCFGGRRLGILGLVTVLALIVWLVIAERLGLVAPLLDPVTVSMQRASMLLFIVAGAYSIGATYESARRLYEQRLVEVSRLASLGTMAGGIAHEINNPLAVIAGYGHRLGYLAESGPLDAQELAGLSQRIVAMTKRMAAIVAGLRAYARDDCSEAPLPTLVAECIDDACAFGAERFKNAGVELRQLPVPADLRILARKTQVTQVLLNLLNNAFDAVEPLPQKWVEIGCSTAADMVTVTVTDAGPGLPPEVLANMFVPFFTTKEVGRGTGLGLAICAGIMARHGGDIGVDERAKNTRFLVRFPRSAE